VSVNLNNTGTQRAQRTTTPNYNSAYTLLLWVQVDDYNNARIVFKTRVDDSNYDQVYVGGNRKFHCNGVSGGTDQHQGDSDYMTSIGTWAAYALVRTSATELRQYAGPNPDALVETIHGGATIAGRAAAVELNLGSSGVDADDLGLSGRVAGARMYASALTQAQIATELKSAQPVLAGSWGSWRLGSVTEITDDSGNARPLTLNGTPTTSGLQPPSPWGMSATASGSMISGTTQSDLVAGAAKILTTTLVGGETFIPD
jgi:hypothetical protein